MYLWRRRATPAWWAAHENTLQGRFGEDLAVIEAPNRQTLLIEITCHSPQKLKEFGGRARKLPRDWLKRFVTAGKTKPIRIGTGELVIPAGAAFGTGEHATTSMCLTMLKEHFTKQNQEAHCRAMLRRRRQRTGKHGDDAASSATAGTDNVVDIGTGSGILALAARLLGAPRVVAIDNDPVAIRSARQNASRNHIRGVQFLVADARMTLRGFDLLCANLYSELLIDALPRWRGISKLILSGILRRQQADVTRALHANGFAISTVRRRGKWVAILARGRGRRLGAPRTAQRSVRTSAARKRG